MGTAGVGLLLGILGAIALTRLLGSLLFGVSALGPLTIHSAPLVLTIVSLTACLLPARRATRVDPVVILRADRAPGWRRAVTMGGHETDPLPLP